MHIFLNRALWFLQRGCWHLNAIPMQSLRNPKINILLLIDGFLPRSILSHWTNKFEYVFFVTGKLLHTFLPISMSASNLFVESEFHSQSNRLWNSRYSMKASQNLTAEHLVYFWIASSKELLIISHYQWNIRWKFIPFPLLECGRDLIAYKLTTINRSV